MVSLVAMFVALFTTATVAQEVLLILAGSKSGSSAQRNNIYAEETYQLQHQQSPHPIEPPTQLQLP